jgi:aminopeptidase-like protein
MKDFDEYIDWRVNSEKRLQKDFVTDQNGELIVDFVGRYENLLEDFQHVCEALNLAASLPHLNKSPHMDYRSYYTGSSIKIIEENFKDDIEFFGYSF